MSILKNISAVKKTLNLLRKQVELEQKTFEKYKVAVEKYKELCKHDATNQELTDALIDVSKAWDAHKTQRKPNVDQSNRSS